MRSLFASAFALLGVSACGTIFGVDFDDAFPRGPDAGSSIDGTSDPGIEPVPSPVPPGPDGTCDADRKLCGGLCVSFRDPAFGCAAAACDPCSIAHGAPSCNAGSCAVGSCAPTYANCNGDVADGCETNTDKTPTSCGACGITCAAGQVCSNGGCAASCEGGEVACGSSCIDPKSDADHCGACDTPCVPVANGVATCASSTCQIACNEGFVKEGNACVDTPLVGRTLAARGWSACALRTDGTAACWGSSFLEASAAGAFVEVSVGAAHGVGLRQNGAMAAWGTNESGEVSPLPAGPFLQATAGESFGCAVRASGAVTCWGANPSGAATPMAGTFRQVSSGTTRSCGLRSDGTIACWGEARGVVPSGKFRQVSVGMTTACALRVDGTIACWGSNDAGQSAPPAGAYVELSVGDVHGCAVRADGGLVCWGSNGSGQRNVPAGTYKHVVAASTQTCAVRSDGTLACWGADVPNFPPSGMLDPPAGTFQ